MPDNEFITHMSETITKTYGQSIRDYVLNNVINEKYISASDVYYYIYPNAYEENIIERAYKEEQTLLNAREMKYRKTPIQSNFDRFYKKAVEIVRDKYKNILKQKICLELINDIDTEKNKGTECTYWENLLITAWIFSLDKQLVFNKNYFNDNKKLINESIYTLIADKKWFLLSICKTTLWSIELLRLRLFLYGMNDSSISFLHALDWIDIFEFRVIPVVLKNIGNTYFGITEITTIEIQNYFFRSIKEASEFPFAERFGIEKNGRKSIWRARINMLPQRNKVSDVNTKIDSQIYEDFVKNIKKKANLCDNSTNVRDIRSILDERNKIRNCAESNGSAYSCVLFNIVAIDEDFIEYCCDIFREMIDSAYDSPEMQKDIIIIYHMIQKEISYQEAEDVEHRYIEIYKEKFKTLYERFCKDAIEKIAENHTDNKALIMDMYIGNISNEHLAEMVILGAEELGQVQAEAILNQVYNSDIDTMDNESKAFANASWNKLDNESKVLYAKYHKVLNKFERINCINERYLSKEEMNLIESMTIEWISRIKEVHGIILQ